MSRSGLGRRAACELLPDFFDVTFFLSHYVTSVEFFQPADRSGVKILIVLVTFEEHLKVMRIASLHLRGKFPQLLDHLVLFDARHLIGQARETPRRDVPRGCNTLSCVPRAGLEPARSLRPTGF